MTSNVTITQLEAEIADLNLICGKKQAEYNDVRAQQTRDRIALIDSGLATQQIIELQKEVQEEMKFIQQQLNLIQQRLSEKEKALGNLININ